MWRLVYSLPLLVVAGGLPALGGDARYELFPEQSVRRSGSNWVSSAYVLDKKANQFWVCTARYNFDKKEANKVDCTVLASDIGRPSLTERYRTAPILGATLQGADLPVFWFIEPSFGDVQFCDPRHAGVCVHIVLP